MKLFKIYDMCIVYANNKSELNVQLVNGKYIFIEMETKTEYVDRIYNSAEDLIEDINSYNLPISKDSYYVKKAELMLNEVLKKEI